MIVSPENRTEAAPSTYVRMMLRRKLVIALPMVVGGAVAYLMAISEPPQYTAEAMLALDTRKVQVIQIDSVVSRLPQEDGVLRTELDALSSRSMATRVAKQLDLIHNSEFLREIYAPTSAWLRLAQMLNGRLAEESGLAKATAVLDALETPPSYWQRLLDIAAGTSIDGAPVGAVELEPIVGATPMELIAVNWLLNGLRVSNDGRSFTIRVSFVSHSADLSTAVANAFADAYLTDQVEVQVRATQSATAWLSQRLEEMRLELEESEAAVQRFRRETDLLEVSGTTTAAQQLSELNAELISARSERLRLEARLDSVEVILQDSRDADVLPDLISSPTVETLQRALALSSAETELLRDELGPRHPRRIAAEAQLMSLNRQLAVEIERARRSLENEVLAARKREAHLQSILGAGKGEYGEGGEAIVRLNQLQRESEANRALYESLLNRYKQTLEQEELATPEARLLSRAVPPGVPSGPRKLPILLLGLIGGGVIGGGLAGVLEWRDRSIRRASEIEQMIGVPVFGILPSVGRGRAKPEQLILERPHSPFSEALRRAIVSFQLSHGSAGVKVIMVTSATAGEGKTTFCAAAARALALTGMRVLVIDADLHRPRIAATFGRQASGHISDVIRGRATLEEAVSKDALSNVHFLPALSEGGNSRVLLLESDGFAVLIERARARYDLVIIDTPPLLAKTDAAAVGTLADANLFLVRWGKTPRAVVMAAVRFFSLCRIAVHGIIMTQANLRRLASYEDHSDAAPYRSASYHRALPGPVEAPPSRLVEGRF